METKPLEHIDLVDKNDNVIGTTARTPEWNATRHTLHRFVDVFVRLSDGRFLMQQRATHKKGAGKFNSPVGGLVPAGMSYEEAAQMELREELGIENPVRFVAKFTDTHADGSLSAFAHLYEVVSDGPFTGWEAEAERLEYFTRDELDYMTERFPYLFSSGFLHAWKIYNETLDQ